MRSYVRPPPSVNINPYMSTLNIPEEKKISSDFKLSNWQREGYPSEYAYAKAVGLLDTKKAIPPPFPTGVEPSNQSFSYNTSKDDYSEKFSERPPMDKHAFEAAVKKEMQALEASLQNMNHDFPSQRSNQVRHFIYVLGIK